MHWRKRPVDPARSAYLAMLLIVGLVLLLGSLLSCAARAQQPACGDRTELLRQLREQFKEGQAGFGMTGNGAVVELMVGENGSWTLILSMPNGTACMIASGQGWETIERKNGKDI